MIRFCKINIYDYGSIVFTRFNIIDFYSSIICVFINIYKKNYIIFFTVLNFYILVATNFPELSVIFKINKYNMKLCLLN